MDAAETGEGAGSKEQLNQETKTTQQILAEQQLEKKRKRRKRKRWNPKAANTSMYFCYSTSSLSQLIIFLLC